MNKLRIASSSIDNFLRIGGVDYERPSEIYTAEKYIADVQKGWQPKRAMLFGSAFGAVIAEPEKYWRLENESEIWEIAVKKLHDFEVFNFDKEQALFAINLMADYVQTNGMFFEVKTELQFGDVTVVCKCDGLAPNFIIENKTTSNLTLNTHLFDCSPYQTSAQWKFYLLAFPEAEFVRYHVFEFAKETQNGYRSFHEHNEFECFRYDGLEYECRAIIESMSAFIYQHNLEPYFQPYKK